RVKEEANDYRYFPEPDIPPFKFESKYIDQLKKQIPELPYAKISRFVKDYELSEYNAEILTRERNMADYYEDAVKIGKEYKITPKQIANTIINKKPDIDQVLPASLIKQILEETKVESVD